MIWPDGFGPLFSCPGQGHFTDNAGGPPAHDRGDGGRHRKKTGRRNSILSSRPLLKSTDDAVIGKTMDGKVVSWNPAAERVYGYSASEMLGKKPITLIVSPGPSTGGAANPRGCQSGPNLPL